MDPLLIDQLFANTTVATDALLTYAIDRPQWRQTATELGYSAYMCEMAGWADVIEHTLREYVCGISSRFRLVSRSIQAFISRDEAAARKSIVFLLDWIKQTLLLNEWFELMPRYERLCQYIAKTFAITV